MRYHCFRFLMIILMSFLLFKNTSSEPTPLTFEEFKKQCTEKFKETFTSTFPEYDFKIINTDEFNNKPKQSLTENDFQYSTKFALGKIDIHKNDKTTTIANHIKMKGIFKLEKYRHFVLNGEITTDDITSCEGLASDLNEFLSQKPDIAPNDIKDIFLKKFNEAQNKNDQLKVVEILLENEKNETKSVDRTLIQLFLKKEVKNTSRKLAKTDLQKYMLLLKDEKERTIGNIFFNQFNKVSMLVRVDIPSVLTMKTFISFYDKIEAIEIFLDDLAKKIHGAKFRYDVPIEEITGKLKSMMKTVNCEVSDDKLTKSENNDHIWMIWVPTEEAVELDMDEFRRLRERRLWKEGECPFGSINIIVSKITVNGFPNLNIAFEANNGFSKPMKLEYFIVISEKEDFDKKIDLLWKKFVQIFKDNLIFLEIESEKNQKYSKELNEYLDGVKAGFKNGIEPVSPAPEAKSALLFANDLKVLIGKVHKSNQPSLEISIVDKISTDENTPSQFSIFSHNKLFLQVVVFGNDDYPRAKITFFGFVHDSGTKDATYQIDVSSDSRMNQMKVAENDLIEYFKNLKMVV